MAAMSMLLDLLDALDDRPQARELRERTYAGLGATVVDVGCGGGRAVGVDLDPDMAEVAARRWPAGEFRVADAAALPLPDGSVTGYRADKVLHALPAPAAAVAEARRVPAPGGRAVLVGQDWDTVVIDSDDPETVRSLVHARADRLPHPRIARRHRGLLLDHGFTDVTVEVHILVWTDAGCLPVLATIGEGDRLDEQTARARADRLFVALPMFLASGTRGR